MMMRMEHRLVQTQTQRLMLTQKMQQALQILQYTSVELEHHVQQELETNPVLEQLPAEEEVLPERKEETSDGHDAETFDDKPFDLDVYESRWEQRIKEGRDFSVNPDMAARRDYYENSITKEESFSALLLRQARMAFPDAQAYALCERIIGDINDRGYFTASLEEIAKELNVSLPDAERTLYRIQKFEPTGVGARDVVECLLLQINAEYPKEAELRKLVEDHLEDLENRRIPKIAKAMKITPERVEALRTLLSTLDPWPGLEYTLESPQYIASERIVEKIECEQVVYL
ncbi:MAG: hypothetical protein IIB38_17050, partial [Candidatus Hydrogenedentes bacterium]|nr:hypothetical protein [Candidatus Hydrogenedentota bacterium]